MVYNVVYDCGSFNQPNLVEYEIRNTFEKNAHIKNMDITFARFPPSVMAGDVLIAYSVKTQRMLSVFTAIEERGPVRSFKRERNKQWPWYAKCKKDTLKFGQNWPNIELTLRGLREAYLKENPSAMVTIRSQNFEAIRGHDHMRLDANFAEFVIRKIMERTQKLL